MAYKVVSAQALRDRGVDIDAYIYVTVIVDGKYFDGNGMVPLGDGDFDDVEALDGLGGLILNMTAEDNLFSKDGTNHFIPSANIRVCTAHDFKEKGNICGIPVVTDLLSSNLELIPEEVPIIIRDTDKHKARGRNNTYIAQLDRNSDMVWRRGVGCRASYIKNLVDYI